MELEINVELINQFIGYLINGIRTHTLITLNGLFPDNIYSYNSQSFTALNITCLKRVASSELELTQIEKNENFRFITACSIDCTW